jgi:ribosomal protein S18 acetylase RimI-like enzyme
MIQSNMNTSPAITDQRKHAPEIVNTNLTDLPIVLWLFEQAMTRNNQHGYKVWTTIDRPALQKDIENNLQYKVMQGKDVSCIFSVQFSDPSIWGERDASDAIYLHRIVVHPDFKGQRQFEDVLAWSKQLARQRQLTYIRMDTWADNARLIQYYQSFGFVLAGLRTTADTPDLPIQNRNLKVALLAMKVS